MGDFYNVGVALNMPSRSCGALQDSELHDTKHVYRNVYVVILMSCK